MKGGTGMYCPTCHNEDSRVIDSRSVDEGQAIRRRRECPECGHRFTTLETPLLTVLKRNGVTEYFSRDKVVRGVRRACQGRSVDEASLRRLAQQVPAHEIGLAILGPLQDLDEVAYLRFASVYKQFSSADDFEREIISLRERRETR